MPISKSRQERIDIEQILVDKFNDDPVGTEYKYYKNVEVKNATSNSGFQRVITKDIAFVGANNIGIVKINLRIGYALISHLGPA